MTKYVSSKISHRAIDDLLLVAFIINVSIVRSVEVCPQSLQSILVHFLPFLHITHGQSRGAGHHVHMLPLECKDYIWQLELWWVTFPHQWRLRATNWMMAVCVTVSELVVPQAAFFHITHGQSRDTWIPAFVFLAATIEIKINIAGTISWSLTDLKSVPISLRVDVVVSVNHVSRLSA